MTSAMVERLRAAWAHVDELVLRAVPDAVLPTGLSEDEVQQRGAHIGLAFSDEIVAYYGCHDGWGRWAGLLRYRSEGLLSDIANTKFRRSKAAQLAAELGVTPDEMFSPQWYTAMSHPSLGPVLDCSGPSYKPAPVLLLIPEALGEEDHVEIAFASLAEYLEGFAELLDAGAYAFRENGIAHPTEIMVPHLTTKGVYD